MLSLGCVGTHFSGIFAIMAVTGSTSDTRAAQLDGVFFACLHAALNIPLEAELTFKLELSRPLFTVVLTDLLEAVDLRLDLSVFDNTDNNFNIGDSVACIHFA